VIGVTFRESDAVFGLVLMNAGMQNVGAREGQLLALSSRTWADRERPQRIGYDALGEPTMNERYLRVADVHCPRSPAYHAIVL
jgi:hypothetical protein